MDIDILGAAVGALAMLAGIVWTTVRRAHMTKNLSRTEDEKILGVAAGKALKKFDSNVVDEWPTKPEEEGFEEYYYPGVGELKLNGRNLNHAEEMISKRILSLEQLVAEQKNANSSAIRMYHQLREDIGEVRAYVEQQAIRETLALSMMDVIKEEPEVKKEKKESKEVKEEKKEESSKEDVSSLSSIEFSETSDSLGCSDDESISSLSSTSSTEEESQKERGSDPPELESHTGLMPMMRFSDLYAFESDLSTTHIERKALLAQRVRSVLQNGDSVRAPPDNEGRCKDLLVPLSRPVLEKMFCFVDDLVDISPATGALYAGLLLKDREGEDKDALKVNIHVLDKAQESRCMDFFDQTEKVNKIAAKCGQVVPMLSTFKYGSLRFVITPFMKGSNLTRFIQKQAPVADNVAAQFCKQIARGLYALHKSDIAHGCLSPSTIMFRDGKRTQIGLTTYFFSSSETLTEHLKKHTFNGAEMRVPAEISAAVEAGCKRDFQATMAGDMWALGCIAHALVTGAMPSVPDSAKPWKADKAFLKKHSGNLADFLSKLLCPEPDARLTAKTALMHPWLNV